SISNSFSKFSKSLMVNFIYRHHFDYSLAELVKPRKKFKIDFSQIDIDVLTSANNSLKDLDSLISEIENNHIKVPVLLRQYIGLNAKIICFNIDPKFSDSLDGFLILDLKNVPQDILDRLSKNI
ncbi:hemolysin, partial [Pseudoxanthomonas sp. SGD-10]